MRKIHELVTRETAGEKPILSITYVYGGEGGDSNPRYRFWPVQRFSKRVIALWLASKLLTTKDAVRLALDSLRTVGSILG